MNTELKNDFDFAHAECLAGNLRSGDRDNNSVGRDGPVLRYVAALHPELTRAEFVAAAVQAGYRANSAARRFAESRAFDRDENGMHLTADGRLLDEPEVL
jgi:hypothetical protein